MPASCALQAGPSRKPTEMFSECFVWDFPVPASCALQTGPSRKPTVICLCLQDTCTALRGTGKKMDPRMKEGLRWLLATIEGQGDKLKDRVESDMKAVDEQRKAEAAARRERVRKQREERFVLQDDLLLLLLFL